MAVNRRTGRRRAEGPRSWKAARPSPQPPAAPPSSSPAPRRPRRRRPIEPGAIRIDGPAPASPRPAFDEVLDDFTRSWDRGEGPRAEVYLGRLPVEDKAELVYHEYCLAESAGLGPDPGDFLRRFPDQADSLRRLFSLHGAFSASSLRGLVDRGGPILPEAGDAIGPYRLIRELGRGAFARVFLAEQADLGDRLVVVKVATRASSEPRLLARARHPHIVEVLRQVEADAEGGTLHLVCMPFLGGATLAAVLDRRRALGRPARSGRDLLGDLDRASAPEYRAGGPDRPGGPGALAPEAARPAREVIAGLSHARALAWVVARLAEALDHARRKGVTHGDLKPSNILLTADATPMLFDFNLAVDRNEAAAGPAGPADPGGTLPYMAPERLEAIAGLPPSAGKGPDPHRADLYALGLVLFEALTGRRPAAPRPDGDARRFAASLIAESRGLASALAGTPGRTIPPALRSILAKCLEPDPLDRYADGGELAEDLDRWRTDRRLAFAEECPRASLARRARSRRPALLAAALTMAFASAVASVASAWIEGSMRDQALAKLALIYARPDSGAFDAGRARNWALDEPETSTEPSSRQLARYDAAVDPAWPDRDDVRSLPERERFELQAWLAEQAYRQARALARRPDSPDDWRRAAGLLDRTIALFPLRVLRAQRLDLLERLGLTPSPAPAGRVDPAMEAYLAGLSVEDQHAREALEHYTEALKARPGFFWAHYRAAGAATRLDEAPLAVLHLRECVGRWPDNPLLRTMLAKALYAVEYSTPKGSRRNLAAESLDECEQALRIDPDYVPARQLRAVLRSASGHEEQVRSDLDRLRIIQGPFRRGHDLSVQLGLASLPGPDFAHHPDSVKALARQVLAEDPADLEARAIIAVGLNRDRKYDEALVEYDRILDANPANLQLRFQKAVIVNKRDHARAIEEFGRLIDEPRFEEVFALEPLALRAFHFVAEDRLLAGRLDDALRIAERSLVFATRNRTFQEPVAQARGSGPGQFLLALRGESYFLLARIHAAFARAEPGRIDRVVECLDRSFACRDDFRTAYFPKERIFDDLRDRIVARFDPGPADR